MKIVLATHNPHKRAELIPLLKPLGFDILTLDDFPTIGEIIEDGETLLENALIKARSVHTLTGLPSLADDTGLEVDALNGAPGVYSARFAGENCSYSDNVRKLLSVLSKVEPPKRTARFKTIMAFTDGKLELTAEGIVEGQILHQPKGVAGFGYDPVFYIHEMEKTFAQMTSNEKSKISHRGIAVRKMAESLHHLYSSVNRSKTLKKETA
ncbi:MAG: RdgB/HAM1 family non-canonical purine NTP pyrophosphatase [Candidatus Marinimicrobia bacterium]|nr:RdgB/HAM1 family non-canonical purine NTP pyrophosphatase [Candidatus Neomarinimicrobiota bacterium]